MCRLCMTTLYNQFDSPTGGGPRDEGRHGKPDAKYISIRDDEAHVQFPIDECQQGKPTGQMLCVRTRCWNHCLRKRLARLKPCFICGLGIVQRQQTQPMRQILNERRPPIMKLSKPTQLHSTTEIPFVLRDQRRSHFQFRRTSSTSTRSGIFLTRDDAQFLRFERIDNVNGNSLT